MCILLDGMLVNQAHLFFLLPMWARLRRYHGRLFQYALERQGRLTDDPSARYNATMHQQADRMQRGAYPIVQIVPNKYGFTKGMRDSDAPEDVWPLGGPVFFPYLVYPNGGNSGSMRHDYQLGGSTLRMTWTATAPIGSSFSSCTRRPTG